MPNVMPDQADTYKCFAKNEYGQATVTVVLNVIEGKGCLLAMLLSKCDTSGLKTLRCRPLIPMLNTQQAV